MDLLSLDPKRLSLRQRLELALRGALRSAHGVTSIEYALIAGTIFTVIIVSAGRVGSATGALFDLVARLVGN